MLGIGSSAAAAAVNSEGWRQAGELALAFGLSAVIGLEREIRQKNAGLRTQILVGVGAALFMLISKYGFTDVQARGVGRFRLCYRRLVATNSAVITVADEPNQLSGLRRELIVLLRVAGGASAGDLVHITLFATPRHFATRHRC
jgi:hypothetical protein